MIGGLSIGARRSLDERGWRARWVPTRTRRSRHGSRGHARSEMCRGGERGERGARKGGLRGRTKQEGRAVGAARWGGGRSSGRRTRTPRGSWPMPPRSLASRLALLGKGGLWIVVCGVLVFFARALVHALSRLSSLVFNFNSVRISVWIFMGILAAYTCGKPGLRVLLWLKAAIWNYQLYQISNIITIHHSHVTHSHTGHSQ